MGLDLLTILEDFAIFDVRALLNLLLPSPVPSRAVAEVHSVIGLPFTVRDTTLCGFIVNFCIQSVNCAEATRWHTQFTTTNRLSTTEFERDMVQVRMVKRRACTCVLALWLYIVLTLDIKRSYDTTISAIKRLFLFTRESGKPQGAHNVFALQNGSSSG